MKLRRLGSLLLAAAMVSALFAGCSRKPELSETLAAPDDTWYKVTAGESVSEMEKTEEQKLIESIIGKDSGWDGDYTKLSEIQKSLIVLSMAERGYTVKVVSDGILYLSSAPAPSEEEFKAIAKEALGEDYEWQGDYASLTSEQITVLQRALKKAGYTAKITNSGISYTNEKSTPKDKMYYENPSEGEVNAVVYDVLGKEEFNKWNGDFNKIEPEKLDKVIGAFNDYGYNVGVSDDGKRLEALEKAPESTTAAQGSSGGTVNTSPSGSTTTAPATTSTTAPAEKNIELKQTALSTFGGTSGDRFVAVEALKDGGYVVIGNFNSTNGDCTGMKPEWQNIKSAVIKYDSSGKMVWKDFIGGTGGVTLNCVTELSDGSIVAAGYTSSKKQSTLTAALPTGSGPSNIDALVIKYSADGEYQTSNLIKGSEGDMIYCIEATPDGDFVVGGKTMSCDGAFSTFTEGMISAFLIRFKPDCKTIQWPLAFEGSKHMSIDGIAIADDGYIFAVCNTASGDGTFAGLVNFKGTSDAVVMKISMNGKTPIWSRPLVGSGTDIFSAIAVTPDGGCIVGGQFMEDSIVTGSFSGLHNYGTSDGLVVKYSQNGELEWKTQLGGSEADRVMAIATVNGGYVAVGQTASANQAFSDILNRGDLDVFAVHISEKGAVDSFMQTVSGAGNDTVIGMTATDKNHVILVGGSRSSDGAFSGASPVSNGSKNIAYTAFFTIKK